MTRHVASRKRDWRVELKEVLLTRQKEVLASIRRDQRDLWEGSVDGTDHPLGTLASRPALTPEAEVGYGVINHRAQLLDQIHVALNKLEEGTYGLCEMCGEAIPVDRLRALPFASRCIGCQQAREREQTGKTVSILRGGIRWLS